MNALEDYRTDVLFLLIGANPLPNYVAAMLLTNQNGIIYLLHTPGETGTYEVAQRLMAQLHQVEPSFTIHLVSVDGADGEKIEKAIGELTSTLPQPKTVGLNFTGGTKPMAAHVYHILKQRFPLGCFSYLDAHNLTMVIRRGSEHTQMPSVVHLVELSLQDLLEMHGYVLPKADQRQKARASVLCRVIAEIHSSVDGYGQWRAWRGDKDSCDMLPSAEKYPRLTPFVDCLSSICNDVVTESDLADLLQLKSFACCAKFLNGEWLEEYTLACLQQATSRLGLKDPWININARRQGKADVNSELNLDVAAMYGYRLFSISCQATEVAQQAKYHLFEVFTRARQLGGDEARLALVCCVDSPENLESKIARSWEAPNKIRVFGREHLATLPYHLQEWLETVQ
jgi:hypothetical protein